MESKIFNTGGGGPRGKLVFLVLGRENESEGGNDAIDSPFLCFKSWKMRKGKSMLDGILPPRKPVVLTGVYSGWTTTEFHSPSSQQRSS